MRKLFSVFIVFVLLISPINLSAQNRNVSWEDAKNASLDWIAANIRPGPVVGSVGGEWAVIAMARAGRITADDPWARAYLRDLDRTIREVNGLINAGNNIQQPPSAGTFPSEMRRWTDFQRISLALSSLGLDASDYNGNDLTEIFRTFVPIARRHALNQSINADIFALIALDSNNFSGSREVFIRSILNNQRDNGSWGLGASPMSTDLDTTAMAIQALALYYDSNVNAAAAIDKALAWLQTQTFQDPESVSQMIVALTALGPDFAEEAEYYVNLLLRWFDPATGGFNRSGPRNPVNIMTTEQAAYALVAYYRFVNGMAPLYDMGDCLTAS